METNMMSSVGGRFLNFRFIFLNFFFFVKRYETAQGHIFTVPPRKNKLADFFMKQKNFLCSIAKSGHFIFP